MITYDDFAKVEMRVGKVIEVNDFPEAYLHHLWESFAWEKYMSKLTVEDIQKNDTTYNLIARRFL